MYKYLFGMFLCIGMVTDIVPNWYELPWYEQGLYVAVYPIPVGTYIYANYVRNQEGE